MGAVAGVPDLHLDLDRQYVCIYIFFCSTWVWRQINGWGDPRGGRHMSNIGTSSAGLQSRITLELAAIQNIKPHESGLRGHGYIFNVIPLLSKFPQMECVALSFTLQKSLSLLHCLHLRPIQAPIVLTALQTPQLSQKNKNRRI